MSSKTKTRKAKKKREACISASGDRLLSLSGFRATDVPDVTALKFVYSDYRVLTAAANQAEYVYRANSIFDPDQSGVGGQPDGFDQWKALYGVYRVVAVEFEVEAIGNGANTNGMLAVAPSDTAGGFSSAEELAGLRHSAAATYSQTSTAKVKKLVHIGQLAGRNDAAVLDDPNFGSVYTTNPVSQYYIVVGIETGNSATGQTMVWTKLTYYTRLENPIAVLDSASRHRLRVAGGLPPAAKGSSLSAPPPPEQQLTQVAQSLERASLQLAAMSAAPKRSTTAPKGGTPGSVPGLE